MQPTTHRETRRAILKLAVPASLEGILQACLGFTDQVVVGHLGEAPMVAAGITNNLMFLITLVIGAIATSGSILVAQHHGRGDSERVVVTTGCASLVMLVLAVPPTLVAIAFPVEVLQLIGASDEVVARGYNFFRIILLTLPMTLFSAVMVGVLRSLGDSRTPMLITMTAVISNTVLSLTLVFGLGPIPAFGVEGAAMATAISQLLRLGLLAYFLFARQRVVTFRLAVLKRFDWQVTRSLLVLAYPMLLTDVFWGLGNFIYTLLYVRLGTTTVAATQIINSTLGIVNTFPLGLAVAALILIGQSVGSGDVNRVNANSREIRRFGFYVSIALSLVFIAVCVTLRMFYPNISQDTVDGAILGLLLNALFYPAMVTNIVVGSGVLRGGGDTRFTMVASLVSIYAIGLPLTFVLAFWMDLGLWAVFLGKGAEEVSRAAMLLARCRTNRWMGQLQAPPVSG